jgi:Uma2 family endonuclease
MAKPARETSMTVREFLRWEDGTDTRYELVHGHVVAMAPPTGRHVVIARNIHDALSPRLRRPCASYFGAGVARSEHDDECRLPDVLVTCEATPDRLFTAPRLVVEVLSPTTEKDDRTDKLDFYRTLPSVEAVLLVWQDKPRAQLHSRQERGWLVQDLVGGGRIELLSLGVSLTLDEIYEGVELPATEAASGGT